jgi:hypothetical protein
VLAELVSTRLQGATLIDWRLVAEHDTEDEFIVMWRVPKDFGDNSRAEFGVHRALVGSAHPILGKADLVSGDYYWTLDQAVKRYKAR